MFTFLLLCEGFRNLGIRHRAIAKSDAVKNTTHSKMIDTKMEEEHCTFYGLGSID